MGVHRVRSGTHGFDRAQQAGCRPGSRVVDSRGHRGDDRTGLRQHVGRSWRSPASSATYVAARPARHLSATVDGLRRQAGTLTFTIEPDLFGFDSVVSGAPGAVVPTLGRRASHHLAVTAPGRLHARPSTSGRGRPRRLFAATRARTSPSPSPQTSSPRRPTRSRSPCGVPHAGAVAHRQRLRRLGQPPPPLRVDRHRLRYQRCRSRPIGRLARRRRVPADGPGEPNPPAVSNHSAGWTLDPLFTLARRHGDGWLMPLHHHAGGHTSHDRRRQRHADPRPSASTSTARRLRASGPTRIRHHGHHATRPRSASSSDDGKTSMPGHRRPRAIRPA